MPAEWDANRWRQNEDGSYTRHASISLVVGDYSTLTKAQLAEELGRRGLAKSGSKDELIARLEADDTD